MRSWTAPAISRLQLPGQAPEALQIIQSQWADVLSACQQERCAIFILPLTNGFFL